MCIYSQREQFIEVSFQVHAFFKVNCMVLILLSVIKAKTRPALIWLLYCNFHTHTHTHTHTHKNKCNSMRKKIKYKIRLTCFIQGLVSSEQLKIYLANGFTANAAIFNRLLSIPKKIYPETWTSKDLKMSNTLNATVHLLNVFNH